MGNPGSEFAPQDPGFEARVRASCARQAALASIGAWLETVEPGRVTILLARRDDFTQQHGFLHAGIVATALDSACGYAAFSLMPADVAVLTVEYKVNLLAPARGERFRMTGRVVKPGRTLTVCTGEAHALAGDQPTLIATMQSTIMAVPEREDLRQ